MNPLSPYALAAWRDLLGKENVIEDPESLCLVATATFETVQQVPAILKPGNRSQVQACMKIANAFKVPLYPISTGKNWGYGSRVPPHGGCVVMELSRMNRIIEFDDILGHVTLEPGVTQGQLYEFLQQRKSRFWMDATGAAAETSIIGNTVERGFGHTPYGDRFAHAGNMEVVLPTGQCIHTGLGRFKNAQATKVYRWGVGPYLDGLFTQSRLGIVTRMTLELLPVPDYFQAFYFSIRRDEDLEPLVDTLRELRLAGLVRSAVHIGNDVRVLSSIERYPWKASNGNTPLPPAVLGMFRKRYNFGAWNGSGGLYGSRKEVALIRHKIKKALKHKVDTLRFLDDKRLALATRVCRPYQWLTGIDLEQTLKIIRPVFGMMKGKPSSALIPSVYWRKKTPVPQYPDPDRDHVGLLWISPVAPAEGHHARTMVSIIKSIISKHGFEPAITATLVTERSMGMVVNIAYDRDLPGEDQRARQCHDELLEALVQAGYYPYRLGLQSMHGLPEPDDDYTTFMQQLINALDPNNVLAPGRYE